MHSLAGELHHGDIECYIRCGHEKLSGAVQKVTFVYFSKKFSSVSFEVRVLNRYCSIVIVDSVPLGDLGGETWSNIAIHSVEVEVRIQCSSF